MHVIKGAVANDENRGEKCSCLTREKANISSTTKGLFICLISFSVLSRPSLEVLERGTLL